MSRIETRFEKLKSEDRTAFISFIMAGDPDYARSLDVMKSLPDAGVDIIELGMPFSDPAADGETIQFAGQRALEAGQTLKKTLQMVTEFRVGDADTPIILMGYANPLYSYTVSSSFDDESVQTPRRLRPNGRGLNGPNVNFHSGNKNWHNGLDDFARDASKAGVDGLIIVDLPPEEDDLLQKAAKANGLDIIRLVTPTTDADRLKIILDGASGFLYYVSITGVTGAAVADVDALKPHVEEIKTSTELPVVIGFGIKTPEDAAIMGKIGDGVVVGSAIVDKIKNIGNNSEHKEEVVEFVKSLSKSLRS